MKNQTINFRVEEASRLQLKEISEELNLKESEFIRRAILSYKGAEAQLIFIMRWVNKRPRSRSQIQIFPISLCESVRG